MDDFEFRLVESLQPIRNFFLARVISYGLSSGLFDELDNPEPTAVPEMTERLGVAPHRLAALLRYLAVEGIVRDPEGAPRLTGRGRQLRQFRPWYDLLIGGYANSLDELPALMADGTRYAGRDGAMVGQGSCGVSRYDAIPLVRGLLASVPGRPNLLIDLGCGDGSFVLDLCADGTRGIGIDPDGTSIARARELATKQGASDRVAFTVDTAEDFLTRNPVPVNGSACFIAAFSLQELLGQRGRDAVVTMVRQILDTAPDAHLVVVEVDHRPTDATVMRHGLGVSYYNPYYLLHELTEQRLEARVFWDELFREAGGDIVSCMTTDPGVDSTGLEIGYLLRSANGAGRKRTGAVS